MFDTPERKDRTIHVLGTSHSDEALPKPLRPALMCLKGECNETMQLCLCNASFPWRRGRERFRIHTEQSCLQQAEDTVKHSWHISARTFAPRALKHLLLPFLGGNFLSLKQTHAEGYFGGSLS